MPAAPRKAAAFTTAAVVGVAPLALTVIAAGPAVAHGSMGDPVSRVARCHAEGPESPGSAACAAAVRAGGTQALYDWNGVRIGDAAGRHRELIPDGELCSAGDEAFKGLDLARADWPATSVRAGSYTFEYRVTAPHKGTFEVYITKPGHDPSQPLGWDDLDLAHPVARATDPAASGGFSTFSGTLPRRSGRHLLYTVWQRSDSPEAFYSCSDVTYGGPSSAPSASTPSTTTDPTPQASAKASAKKTGGPASGDGSPTAKSTSDTESAAGSAGGEGTAGLAEPAGGAEGLADTGGEDMTTCVALGGVTVLALGSALVLAAAGRRATTGGRHGR